MRFKSFLSRTSSAALVIAALTAVGCNSSPPKVEGPVEPANLASLQSASAAINAGDLAQARTHQQEAAAQAETDWETRKAADLGRLIDGAEALHVGDVDGARAAWQEIEDYELAREVREKALQIGLQIETQHVEVAEAK